MKRSYLFHLHLLSAKESFLHFPKANFKNIMKIYIRSDSKLMVGVEKGETFTSEDHLLCIYCVSRALDDYLEEKRYEFVYH